MVNNYSVARRRRIGAVPPNRRLLKKASIACRNYVPCKVNFPSRLCIWRLRNIGYGGLLRLSEIRKPVIARQIEPLENIQLDIILDVHQGVQIWSKYGDGASTQSARPRRVADRDVLSKKIW